MLCVDSSRLCMSGLSLCDLCLCYSILGSQFSNKYLLITGTALLWLKIAHTDQLHTAYRCRMQYCNDYASRHSRHSFTWWCCSMGHDNAGLFGDAWFLEKVEIELPLLHRKWTFPHSRWISTKDDDRQLERALYPDNVDFAWSTGAKPKMSMVMHDCQSVAF